MLSISGGSSILAKNTGKVHKAFSKVLVQWLGALRRYPMCAAGWSGITAIELLWQLVFDTGMLPRSGMRAGGARLMGRCCALLCFQGCGDYFVRGRVRWVRLVVCPSWRSVKRAVACAKLWVFRGWRWLVGSPCIPRWLRTFPRSSVGLLSFRL